MKKISNYLNYIKQKGISLSEINPGSEEIALTVEDALYSLELLKESNMPIYGGDVLTKDKKGDLSYVTYSWKPEYSYHFLNWSCERMEDENNDDFIKRSYLFARESITKANEVAKQLGKECYIVIVI